MHGRLTDPTADDVVAKLGTQDAFLVGALMGLACLYPNTVVAEIESTPTALGITLVTDGKYRDTVAVRRFDVADACVTDAPSAVEAAQRMLSRRGLAPPSECGVP